MHSGITEEFPQVFGREVITICNVSPEREMKSNQEKTKNALVN